MQEVIMPDRIITFDGRVLEVFFSKGDSQRFHIAHIGKIELVTSRRGQSRLTMGYTKHNMPIQIGIDESAIADTQTLIAAVQKHMSP